jgi:hypothetical protein
MMQMGFKEWFMVNPPIISTILVFSVLLVAFTLERMWVSGRRRSFRKSLGPDRRLGAGTQRVRDAIALCEVTPGRVRAGVPVRVGRALWCHGWTRKTAW